MEHVTVDCGTGEIVTVPLTDDEMAAEAEAVEAGAVAEQERVMEETNATTLRTQAEAALAANRAFLALSGPTNAQTLAQVKALTRQNSGLIRLLLRKLDGTD